MRRLACIGALLLLVLSPPLLAEEALTNEGVLKMVSLGLGDEVVVAKVREAREVAFRLEVDDLAKLREAGASSRVIEAMLERNRPAPERPERSVAASLGMNFIAVSLDTRAGSSPLSLLRGDMSSSGFGPYRNMFMNYPGLKARVRTGDRRPSLLVTSSAALSGDRYFVAKLDPDSDDGVRSLKISSAKSGLRAVFGSDRGLMAPDEDWIVPFDAVEESPGHWRVSFRGDLKPGEYGWYVGLHAGPQASGLFEFGVD